MDWRFRGHRMQECDVVDTFSNVRKQRANPLAAFTVLLELPAWLDNPTLVLMTAPSVSFHSNRLAIHAYHLRLVIEGIDVTGPTVHEQEDDALGLRREMSGLSGEGIVIGRIQLRGHRARAPEESFTG